jgi:hypothetical protein
VYLWVRWLTVRRKAISGRQHARKLTVTPRRRGDALGDPRDMVKAGLHEAQSPEGAKHRPPEIRLIPVSVPAAGCQVVCRNPPGHEAMLDESI